MPIYDIYSKRQKRLRGELPDVYQYDTIPIELRHQVIHIWNGILRGPRDAYRIINDRLSREYGKPRLSGSGSTYTTIVHSFFLRTDDMYEAIDVIEESFKIIDNDVRSRPLEFANSKISPDEAIDELNYRFREHGVGYQYESSQIVRVDSEFIHSEVVKAALSMLSDPMYEGANAYFLSAHDRYRAKQYEDCMNDCLKAFESCIIAICEVRNWDYDK